MGQPLSTPATAQTTAPGQPAGPPVGAASSPDVVVREAEFAPMNPTNGGVGLGALDHLLGVSVTITCELGRVTKPIGEVLKYGVGAVVELSRNVSDPVELLVQGVRIARGEVVVVEDRFAVRITEIADPKHRQER